MAAQLHLQSVITPTQKETVKEVESYIQKPLVIETFITVDTPPKPRYKPPQGDVTILYADNTNNCVAFSKRETGITKTMGAGGRLAINSQEPKVGFIGSLIGTPHAVVIEKVDGELVTFKESNYKKNFITRRTLPKSQFIGYIN